MQRPNATLFLIFFTLALSAQQSTISGVLLDTERAPVEFVNVVLYATSDSSMVKAGNSDEAGVFTIPGVSAGTYFLEATSLGYEDLQRHLTIRDQDIDLGSLVMHMSSIELEEAVVTAERAMVEIKPDRTVFNVQGTINSTGDDAFNLLRKAPGVIVDNNDNITVLGRSGVMLYIDGKRLPLTGDDLANYLKNIPAEQIDRIDIITNPGAKYEAEGTAGIIDIRMKRDKSHGINGSVSTTYTQGRYASNNVSAQGNLRNTLLSAYAQIGFNKGNHYNEMFFTSNLNGIDSDERIFQKHARDHYNFRIGTDFFISKNHTFGFLLSGNYGDRNGISFNRVELGPEGTGMIDSILVADNISDGDNRGNTYNVNYTFDNKKTSLTVDADYGQYTNDNFYLQPNTYIDESENVILSERNTSYTTENGIDIYTFRVDFETEVWGGKLGLGTKLSQVGTDNTFLFYNIPETDPVFNEARSNRFVYDEDVYAGYVNFKREIGEKWNLSAGLRLEQTDATGTLTAFLPTLNEPPVESKYLSAFPSGGLTYQLTGNHTLSLNYGRRINRPDYHILNPFRRQLSELSYSKGNPFLRPEIVNNLELGLTLHHRYNVKLSYSHTLDQITRLIAPDEIDPRAGFITWDNLSEQMIYALNISAPVDITEKWSAFFNLSGSHKDNQADYGGDAVVDVQAWSYSLFQQHTFELPARFTGEISGWFSGPGVWGGVFRYESSWSLNAGLQRRFFDDQMNVRLSVNDIFFEAGWSGTSEFNGLLAHGRGYWDSRRVSLSVSMNFGNSNVRTRKRKSGLEQEASRVGEGE